MQQIIDQIRAEIDRNRDALNATKGSMRSTGKASLGGYINGLEAALRIVEANTLNLAFVVRGSSGSYEDRSEWNVKVFSDLQRATAFAERLNKRAVRLYKNLQTYAARFDHDRFRFQETKYFDRFGTPKPDKLDPGRIWGWTTPSYDVEGLGLDNRPSRESEELTPC